MKTYNRIPVLISAEPGLLRDSLTTLLQSYRFVTVVGIAAGNDNSLQAIAQLHPWVVLIDCSSNPHWPDLAREIHARDAAMRWVAIADTLQTNRLALENGAEVTLTRGFTSHDLGLALQQVTHTRLGWDIPYERKLEGEPFIETIGMSKK